MSRLVEQVERSAWRDSNVAADLAAAGGAGLTLGSALLFFPLGWLGVIVASTGLAFGLAFCALAALKAWPREEPHPAPVGGGAARQSRRCKG